MSKAKKPRPRKDKPAQPVQSVVIKTTEGTGITKRDVLKVADGVNWAAEVIGPHSDYMEEKLQRPADFFDWVSFPCGEWAEAVLREKHENNGPDSPNDFARKMLYHLGWARYHISRGDAAKAAHEAFQLGELATAVKIKQDWEQTAVIGEDYRKKQKEKSEEATKARWAGKDVLNDWLPVLATWEDEIGELLPPSELWIELYKGLREAGLDPNETSGKKPKDSDSMTWEAENGRAEIKFKTFRNRISMIRNSN
jgi:hypothetical protein